MGKQETMIDLKFNNAGMVREVKGAKVALSGLDRVLTSISQSVQAAFSTKGISQYTTAVSKLGKTVRGTLMNIDQIQRLNAPAKGSSSGKSSSTKKDEDAAQRVQAMVERAQALLQPLKNIQFSSLLAGLGKVKDSFQTTGQAAGQAVTGLQNQVLNPFQLWVTETLAPVFTDVWTAAMNAAATALQPVMTGLQNLWAALQPVVSFIADSVVAALKLWQGAFEALGAVFTACSPLITGALNGVATVLTQVWNLVSPILESLRQGFSNAFTRVSQVVVNAANGIQQALSGVSEFLAGGFTGDWKRCWEGIKLYFQGLINGLIGLLNTMLSRLGTSLNNVITAANRLRFTVPDWVPGIGGESFGFHMQKITVPQVPYLAKGAVLPANKPFLAMVGDQKSGTNVEAPLATIQQAVRLEMADMVSGMMAGFEASVGVQKEILQAVLGIEIGDAVIGAATERYNRRQAVIRGGAL